VAVRIDAVIPIRTSTDRRNGRWWDSLMEKANDSVPWRKSATNHEAPPNNRPNGAAAHAQGVRRFH